ncbi:MAG: hypothetical protein LQ352_001647 [Teloschistes flavicans]|nr:MAG: hypothetical protein LQ352_001647 [Teloschistes flavicans]
MGNYEVIDKYTPYHAINASVPFLRASSDDKSPPPFSHLPEAYGFNILLNDNTSAASLDIPVPQYVSSIQQKITNRESWKLSATVNATLATFDDTFQVLDDTVWKPLFNRAGMLSSYRLFQVHMSVGMVVDKKNLTADGSEYYSPHCVIGYYPEKNPGSPLSEFRLGDKNIKIFRNSSPMKFDIRRGTCTATWEITKTNIQLIKGSCTHTPSNQRWLPNTLPFNIDALPVMYNTIRDYSPQGSRNASQWRMPALVTSVATMYWARSLFNNSRSSTQNPELYYPATNETVYSTNTTLSAHWLLYFVLCLQPILTLSMLAFAVRYYDTPIDKGFGLVAVLSGVDKQSLDIMHGAALSGELKKPVSLKLQVLDEGAEEEDMTSGRIRYTVGHEKGAKAYLRRGMRYG